MKNKIFKELEVIELTHDILKHNLKKGARGTVVEIYKNGEAYEIEFVNAEGKTVALLTLDSSEFRNIKKNDMLHVRGFASI